MRILNTVLVKFQNPKYNYSTSVSINSTEEQAQRYFVGSLFERGIYPKENLQKCIGIEYIHSKSVPCQQVLRLMDNDFSYSDALGNVLYAFPSLFRKVLEKELSHYL